MTLMWLFLFHLFLHTLEYILQSITEGLNFPYPKDLTFFMLKASKDFLDVDFSFIFICLAAGTKSQESRGGKKRKEKKQKQKKKERKKNVPSLEIFSFSLMGINENLFMTNLLRTHFSFHSSFTE